MGKSSLNCVINTAFIFCVTTVDDDIDVVHDVSPKFYFVISPEYLSIDSDTGKTLRIEIFEKLLIGPLLFANDRS